MPPFPGEERLVTLFADCHYYFAQPTTRPVLHRFDKASYFYIYYNSTRQTCRIEVANNPGTPEQDAFNGHLDSCRITNSSKFPTMVTLVVDAIDNAGSPTTSKAGRDPDEWRLPSADPRDASQTKYRLHTIDFYFWTQENALLVTGFLKKLLSSAQVDVAEPRSPTKSEPQQQKSPNRQSGDVAISPVVRNLENVAISDPAYRNGQTRNSQNQPQAAPQSIKLPPPPPPPPQPQTSARTPASSSVASPSPVSQSSTVGDRRSPMSDNSASNYAPIAYNPAAPAAPEKIAHREKTPPPEDGEHGTGLSAAAMHDQASHSSYTPSNAWGAPPAASASHISQSSHWGSPPPQSTVSGYGSPAPSSLGYTSPPPPPGSHYQPSRNSAHSEVPSFAPPPVSTVRSDDSHRHSTAAETYTPEMHGSSHQAVETPGTQFYSTVHQPSRPLQHIQPQYPDYLSAGTKPGQQPPTGGWSNYSYSQGGANPSGHHDGQSDQNIHQMVYRPTEEEANAHSKHHKSSSSRPSATTSSSSKGSKSKFFSGLVSSVDKKVAGAMKKANEKGWD